MLTYGDGVADIDVNALVSFHRQHGKYATITAVRPPGRFGALALGDNGYSVERFEEKPAGDGGWINGGFFVMEQGIFGYLSGDDTVLEGEPLQNLAGDGQLVAFRHTGFWQAMDTMRDKSRLDQLCAAGTPPWLRLNS